MTTSAGGGDSECQEGEGHLTNKVTSEENRGRGESKTCRDLEGCGKTLTEVD